MSNSNQSPFPRVLSQSTGRPTTRQRHRRVLRMAEDGMNSVEPLEPLGPTSQDSAAPAPPSLSEPDQIRDVPAIQGPELPKTPSVKSPSLKPPSVKPPKLQTPTFDNLPDWDEYMAGKDSAENEPNPADVFELDDGPIKIPHSLPDASSSYELPWHRPFPGTGPQAENLPYQEPFPGTGPQAENLPYQEPFPGTEGRSQTLPGKFDPISPWRSKEEFRKFLEEFARRKDGAYGGFPFPSAEDVDPGFYRPDWRITGPRSIKPIGRPGMDSIRSIKPIWRPGVDSIRSIKPIWRHGEDPFHRLPLLYPRHGLENQPKTMLYEPNKLRPKIMDKAREIYRILQGADGDERAKDTPATPDDGYGAAIRNINRTSEIYQFIKEIYDRRGSFGLPPLQYDSLKSFSPSEREEIIAILARLEANDEKRRRQDSPFGQRSGDRPLSREEIYGLVEGYGYPTIQSFDATQELFGGHKFDLDPNETFRFPEGPFNHDLWRRQGRSGRPGFSFDLDPNETFRFPEGTDYDGIGQPRGRQNEIPEELTLEVDPELTRRFRDGIEGESYLLSNKMGSTRQQQASSPVGNRHQSQPSPFSRDPSVRTRVPQPSSEQGRIGAAPPSANPGSDSAVHFLFGDKEYVQYPDGTTVESDVEEQSPSTPLSPSERARMGVESVTPKPPRRNQGTIVDFDGEKYWQSPKGVLFPASKASDYLVDIDASRDQSSTPNEPFKLVWQKHDMDHKTHTRKEMLGKRAEVVQYIGTLQVLIKTTKQKINRIKGYHRELIEYNFQTVSRETLPYRKYLENLEEHLDNALVVEHGLVQEIEKAYAKKLVELKKAHPTERRLHPGPPTSDTPEARMLRRMPGRSTAPSILDQRVEELTDDLIFEVLTAGIGLAASARYAKRVAKLGGLADNVAPFVDDAGKYVDNAVGAVAGKIDDVDGVLYYTYVDDVVGEYPTINKRLKQMHEILTDEALRLREIPPGKISPEDLKRLNRIDEQSCAIAAVNANRAAKGEKVIPISLADDLPELNTRSIMRMVDGDTPVSVKNLNNLGDELSKLLPEPNSRGVIVIHNKKSEVVSHAINVENVDGVIWLFEANEGLAVPLGWQRAGIVGIEKIYPIEKIGTLHFINTP